MDEKGLDLNLQGERLCLDFVNTVDWRGSDQPVEFINSYADLVAWGRRKGVLNEGQEKRLLVEAGTHPVETKAVLEHALALREAVYSIFVAMTMGKEPEQKDLELLNNELARTFAFSRILPSGEGYVWSWVDEEMALDRMLWPVVRDAADLLTSSESSRVGKCADEKCGWLFLDNSRNRSRRWCSMKDCGNRAKARRHYQRSHVT
jgi:predicted RNA-binding Zn ribbon-like protein